MNLNKDARVVTADGRTVGHVDRVVIDPRTKEVTHVVHKGVLFTQDKVVPIDLIASAVEDQVQLREDAGDLERLPTTKTPPTSPWMRWTGRGCRPRR